MTRRCKFEIIGSILNCCGFPTMKISHIAQIVGLRDKDTRRIVTKLVQLAFITINVQITKRGLSWLKKWEQFKGLYGEVLEWKR